MKRATPLSDSYRPLRTPQCRLGSAGCLARRARPLGRVRLGMLTSFAREVLDTTHAAGAPLLRSARICETCAPAGVVAHLCRHDLGFPGNPSRSPGLSGLPGLKGGPSAGASTLAHVLDDDRIGLRVAAPSGSGAASVPFCRRVCNRPATGAFEAGAVDYQIRRASCDGIGRVGFEERLSQPPRFRSHSPCPCRCRARRRREDAP